MDPSVVEEPDFFMPERRFSDAVEARKRTPMEMLDHPFHRDLFFSGARRCPGSRVAVNETPTFLAQFIHDWKIEPSSESITSYKDVKYEQQTLLVP
jgi:cytochrome P450